MTPRIVHSSHTSSDNYILDVVSPVERSNGTEGHVTQPCTTDKAHQGVISSYALIQVQQPSQC